MRCEECPFLFFKLAKNKQSIKHKEWQEDCGEKLFLSYIADGSMVWYSLLEGNLAVCSLKFKMHVVRYIDMESLHCAPETNIMYVNYT